MGSGLFRHDVDELALHDDDLAHGRVDEALHVGIGERGFFDRLLVGVRGDGDLTAKLAVLFQTVTVHE